MSGAERSFFPLMRVRRVCCVTESVWQRSWTVGRGQLLTGLWDICNNGKELLCGRSSLLTGLLVGQCSQQRDYVVLAIRTPPKEEESKSNTSRRSDLSNIDEEWIAAHANQVSRMLPGGLLVLGVFTVAAPELAKEIQNTLRKLVFSVEKSVARKRLWNISEEDVSDRVALHLCSATKKYPFFFYIKIRTFILMCKIDLIICALICLS
ncbi:Protein odr-4 homolog [Podarcis lilfordi]|uniref:Protein odr-4 homolog n=1 Tax=Podarcis lilfordi TaxID=74358 RepID=A0AA35KFG3_9SAUR|nr:Protein odr-4 homolog [Podarcis lilfordi]